MSPLTCIQCQKPIEAKPGIDRRFCSSECAKEYCAPYLPPIPCEFCGLPIQEGSEFITRDIIDGKARAYCGAGCAIRVSHDDASCMAMIEFEKYARLMERNLRKGELSPITHADMQRFADKYRTSTKEMEKHWRCARTVLGPDPNDPPERQP